MDMRSTEIAVEATTVSRCSRFIISINSNVNMIYYGRPMVRNVKEPKFASQLSNYHPKKRRWRRRFVIVWFLLEWNVISFAYLAVILRTADV